MTSRSLAAMAAVVLLMPAALLRAAPPLQLPVETAQLRPSPLAGYAIAAQKCGVCHSADYVDYQPPGMKLAQWTAEMVKMQRAYGAPISDEEVRLLGVYLASTYGDATTVSEAERALRPAVASIAPQAAAASSDGAAAKTGVDGLLAANGCLACHAVDRTVVGPAYHAVAAKYRTDPEALAQVAASIGRGGVGRWGAVPMPPFPDLSAVDARALADYVLRQ